MDKLFDEALTPYGKGYAAGFQTGLQLALQIMYAAWLQQVAQFGVIAQSGMSEQAKTKPEQPETPPK